MRKLVIGIAAVALLGLLAVPAMAVKKLDTAEVTVQITVESYGAINFSSDTLSLTVSGPYEPGEDVYCGQIEFNVLCNTNCNLRVDAPVSPATAAPGGVKCYYPTATCASAVDELEHKIGFGVLLRNLKSGEKDPWPDTTYEPHAFVEVSFTMGEANTEEKNASIYVESYMDSARGGDILAPVGVYTAVLDLTLSTP